MTHERLVRAHLRACVKNMRRTKKRLFECKDAEMTEIYRRELMMQKYHFGMTWTCLRHLP